MADERNPDLLHLGEAIRRIREERGVAAAELAAATGVPLTRIAAVEDGCVDPGFELLLTLADGIGVGVSAFISRAERIARERTDDASS